MENSNELQSDSLIHPRTSEARILKKQEAEDIGINADYISAFVDRFYGHIRNDHILGPIFSARVSSWPEHLDRMKSFWRSVLHNSGEFSGNPMLKHMAIPGLNEHHFFHWLTLFDQTLRELQTHPEATRQVSERAHLIAEKLLGGIKSKNNGLNIIAAPSSASALPKNADTQDGFQLPHWIWAAMIASYGVFFAAIAAALGHGEALFVIVVAVCYALIFFGGVAVIHRIGGQEKPSPLAQHNELPTLTGPLGSKEVAAQVLMIPLCVAAFSIVMFVIRLVAIP